MQAIRIHS